MDFSQSKIASLPERRRVTTAHKLPQTSLRLIFLRMAIICACLAPFTYGAIIASGLLLLITAPVILYPGDRLAWLMTLANAILAGSVYVRGIYW